MQRIVFDSDVLIHLYKYIPKMAKFLQIVIPPAVVRETRRISMINELIKRGNIEVSEFSDGDTREVYKIIKRRIKEEVASAYLHGRLKKHAGEYEACYLARKENIPLVVFDIGAWNLARTLYIDVYTLPQFPNKFIPKNLMKLKIEILEVLCEKLRRKEACQELEKLQAYTYKGLY